MVEVAERLESGRGAPKDLPGALDWYRRAVRAGVTLAPALVGETVFERDPIAGLVWLMLALERAPEGAEENALITSSLAQVEPRVTDEAIHAAQVWADACRERDEWPDEVRAASRVERPFRPRPPPPALEERRATPGPLLTKEVRFGPWCARLPPAATLETVQVRFHQRATWGGVHVLHLVWATLAPGVDVEAYVRRSLESQRSLWRPRAAPQRHSVEGLDTTAVQLVGTGPTQGREALKRFVTRDDQVAVLTLVAPPDAIAARRTSHEAVLDSIRHETERA